MFNSVALDVVIGLVFIYLLYSLLATTINEAIAATFNLRAKKLEKAITRMLEDGIIHHYNIWSFIVDFITGKLKKFKNIFLRFTCNDRDRTKNKMSLVESFYDHPGIKYLGENKISNKPSYITPEFFSKALMDILKDKADNPTDPAIKQIQSGINSLKRTNETKKFIQSLLTDANNDLDKFKTLLEQWFNETMYRTTGWYKKQSQRITFIIGFVLAISFNVDTISIVKKLSNDPDAAKALADVAVKYAETHKDSAGHLLAIYKDSTAALFASAKKQIDDDINNANSIIGLGWDIPTDINKLNIVKNGLSIKKENTNCDKCFKKIKKNRWPYIKKGTTEISAFGKIRYVWCMAFSSKMRLLGYLLTALAISFGAPFWFDLLNKFIKLRGAGKKPEEPSVITIKDGEKSSVKRVG